MLRILFIMVIISVTCCGCHDANHKVTVSTVENDIRAHLPIGSSKKDVDSFLDSRKISHGWLQKPEVAANGKVVIPDSHIEEAAIWNVGTTGFLNSTEVSIRIDFKFDNTDTNLVDYSVYEIYKGL